MKTHPSVEGPGASDGSAAETLSARMDFLRHNARRIVVKLGTHTLTHADGTLNEERIRSLCDQITELRARGIEVVIVSSGAIGLGVGNLGMARRPSDLASLQACAAVGQTILMQTWRDGFRRHGIGVAQVLLTHDDVRSRNRHLNCRNTLERLLQLGVVPVVNENDTVSAREIKFGDNDMLSALTASLTRADLLVILSTIPGLLNRTGDGSLVPVVEEITPEIEAMAGGSDNPLATGGMVSKIAAAKVAMRSGTAVYIGDGSDPQILLHLVSGRSRGTFFVPASLSLDAKRRWVAFFESPGGTLHIDAGAAEALKHGGSSLLAKGIKRVEGDFEQGAVVTIAAPEGTVIGRGVARFSADELRAVTGLDSDAIRARLPGCKRTEAVHRNTLVIL